MHFTQRDQENLLATAAEHTQSDGWAPDARAFGAMRDDGSMAAVAVFQNFAGHDADLHFCMIDGARMGAEVVAAIVTMAFHPRALNRERLWVQIAADNKPAQVAALKVGFEFEYRKRAGFRGLKDAIVLSMRHSGPSQAAAKHTENHKSEV